MASFGSGITSKNNMKSTDAYQKVMGRERPLGIFLLILFMLASPFVFRYAFASNLLYSSSTTTISLVGNATIAASTSWNQCVSCTNFNGITLYSLEVEILNVSEAAANTRVPSIAIFASSDMNDW